MRRNLLDLLIELERWSAKKRGEGATLSDLDLSEIAGSLAVVLFQAIDCSDGQVIVAAANDRLWAKFTAEIGRLLRKGAHARLILSVDLIGQAVSVEVDAADVRPY